jgi:hypothetical protein
MKSSTIPIQVALKPKCCKRSKNIFYDDCGFPDETDDYNNCLHNIDGGVILQQKKSPVPQLDVLDPEFHYDFNETSVGQGLGCLPPQPFSSRATHCPHQTILDRFQ